MKIERAQFKDLVEAFARDWIQKNCAGLSYRTQWAPQQPYVLVVFLECKTEAEKTVCAPVAMDMRENSKIFECRFVAAVLQIAALTGEAMDTAKITISNKELRAKYQDVIHSALLCGVLDKAGKFAKAQGISEKDFKFWAEQATRHF